MTIKTRQLAAVLLALFWAGPTTAAALELSHALKLTLQQSPLLQLYPYQQRIDDAAAISAAQRPNPHMQLELADVLGTGESSALRSAELTLSLSQLIELGNKRQKRLELAQWQTELSERHYQLDKVDTLAATMRSFLQLLHQQALLQWTKQKISAEQQLLDLVRQKAQAGTVTDADVTQLELKVLQSQMEQKSLKAEHTVSLRLLASHWAGQPDFDTVAGHLNQLPQLPALADVLTQLQQAPQLSWWLTQERVLDSQLQLAQALGRTDLTVGAGVRRNEQSNSNAFVLQLSMPLALEQPNRGAVLANQAQLEQGKLKQQHSLRQLQLQTERSHLQLTQLADQIHDTRNALLPKAQLLVRQMHSGYQQGIVEMTDLLQAQQEVFVAERSLIDLQYRLHLQLLELERLTGLPMVVQGPQRPGSQPELILSEEFSQ